MADTEITLRIKHTLAEIGKGANVARDFLIGLLHDVVADDVADDVMTTDNDAPAAGLVEALPATGEYVDRLIRVFRDKPHDDTSAVILQDYALAALQAPQESGEAALKAKLSAVESERDEAVNWNEIVDRHGTDQFDSLADRWLSMDAIKRIHNAVASVFSKYANDDILTRFKQHMSDVMHLSFVEGCLVGVRASEAAFALSQPVATPAPSQDAAVVEPDFAQSIATLIKDECEGGAACGWQACSGCHETSEGYETGRYPYSRMFGCHVGSGCSECGGIGVVWEYWSEADLEAMQREDALAATRPVEAQAVAEGWREVEVNYLLKGRRHSPAYFPATGEKCEVSGPNCDDASGYTWASTTVMWQDDIFVLYGSSGFWPVLHKHEHVIFRPLAASPATGGA